ncbi:ATP synthase F1 subunit delta [Desulfovibrio litoralis]|uniref:ATP synthase subunit delta n=1 Tax=Desulfovibrio litoralis DSM 11393 TaxID=1121455 RepID=A0A1M7S8A6_9BACT|nr:ATP synthase F1 subunit delta [Desulfovibrio litoralis]SHN54638.1 ATP synthase F1 subcomplex delta subunit [Desulfovibrio litoralis DSM 11393]
MINSIVARRYAKALFDFAFKKGKDEPFRYGEELGALAFILANSKELENFFSNPVFLKEEKEKLLVVLLEQAKLGTEVKSFCNILLDKGRITYLKDISAFYNVLLDEERGVIRGELITAVELKEPKRKKVQSRLEKQTNYKLDLTYNVNPSILGGIVLKIGDQVMDASLKAQLGMLKDNIKRGE